MPASKLCSYQWDDATGHHECLEFAAPGGTRCPRHKRDNTKPRRVGDIPASLKEAIRRRDNYKCVICGTPGVEVDHIIPLRDFPEEQRAVEANRPDNLQTLCFIHHQQKTVRENLGHLAPTEMFDYTTTSRNRHRRRLRQQGLCLE